MQTYNIFEAKTHLSQIIQQVLNGEEVIIAKAGKPLVELNPISFDTNLELTAKPKNISSATLANDYSAAAAENMKIAKEYSKIDLEGWDEEY
jgi:antitoxin (DNA-binding transcriptional repressor) of toxin-antitoxin stability system